jgi:hypothetical protein
MYRFQIWQEFRLPHPSFKQSRFQSAPTDSSYESFGRKKPERFRAPVFQPVLACEPDSSPLDPDDAFRTARHFHLEENNLIEAEIWYLTAAAENHPDACFHLGFLYETHFRNITKAMNFYQKAIAAGNSYACNNLALLIWSESGPNEEVEKLLKQSQASGNGLSAGALVLFYEATGNIPEMKQTALEFLDALSEEDINNRALAIVLDCLIRQNEFSFLRSQFLMPGSLLMKKAKQYWHVLEIIRKGNEGDAPE